VEPLQFFYWKLAPSETGGAWTLKTSNNTQAAANESKIKKHRQPRSFRRRKLLQDGAPAAATMSSVKFGQGPGPPRGPAGGRRALEKAVLQLVISLGGQREDIRWGGVWAAWAGVKAAVRSSTTSNGGLQLRRDACKSQSHRWCRTELKDGCHRAKAATTQQSSKQMASSARIRFSRSVDAGARGVTCAV
jgi:hypothetical protein